MHLINSALKILTILMILSLPVNAQKKPIIYKIGNEIESTTASANQETPAGNSINSILIISDTIWVGTSRGLSRSIDGGKSWKNFVNTASFGTESVASISYDYTKRMVWASTAHSTTANNQSLPDGSGLHYSSDGGETWNYVPQSVDKQTDTIVVYGNNNIRALPVTVTIQNITYDIANTSDAVWTASFAGGLRKSTDLGKTWQRVVLPPDFKSSIKPTDTLSFCMQPVAGKFCSENNLNYRVFSVVATNDSTLYVGTANGINKSTDRGISWKKMNHQNQEKPISGNFVVGMNYNPSNNSLWAATWKAEDLTESYGISYTTDGGETWQTALDGEKVHNFASFGTSVISCSDNGPFKSTDMGKSWYLPGTIIDKDTKLQLKTNIFYAGCFSNNGNDLWLGSNDGLMKNFSLGSIWTDDWKLFLASQPLGSKEETYAYPNPFSPKTDQLKIKYSTGGKNAAVTIRVFDFGMNYVRTVIQNVQRGDIHLVASGADGIGGVIDYWDGKDESGKTVPNGVYFYRVDIESGTPLFGKILVIQ